MSNILQPLAEPADLDDLSLDRPTSIYDGLREDIIEGRIPADSRLKVRDLAARYGVSTNPVREALQQLRGEGFVVISPNRGARVRPIDEAFLRDTNEIELLIEPYLTRWFAEIATSDDIEELVAIEDEIEAVNFTDVARNSALDTRFHRLVYDRHPNRHILELWWKHREILGAVTRRFPIALGRQAAVIEEHRAVIACLRAHDAAGAEAVMVKHVSGSGRHMMQQIRSSKTR
ncbi:MAG: GntR family transcriptional regulator [Devosia sp.]